MTELRWILLAASAVLLAWIYWQGRRKGLATAASEEPHIREIEPPHLGDHAIVRTRSAPSISTEPSSVRLDDLPEVRIGPAPDTLSMDAALSTSALERLTITQPLPMPTLVSEVSPSRAPVSVSEPPQIAAKPTTVEKRAARKIVALRVAAAAQPLSGSELKEWFAQRGLRHGRYDIFHRYDEHGDVMFSVASMVEPGTFDRATMADARYPGVSLFMQLPSSVDGVSAFDEMLACAHDLQKDFLANVFGERNAPLTSELIERMRTGVADFQHLVSTPRPRG